MKYFVAYTAVHCTDKWVVNDRQVAIKNGY